MVAIGARGISLRCRPRGVDVPSCTMKSTRTGNRGHGGQGGDEQQEQCAAQHEHSI